MCDVTQRRYDTRHEMLTQRALFCIDSNTKKGTLSQQFVTHVASLDVTRPHTLLTPKALCSYLCTENSSTLTSKSAMISEVISGANLQTLVFYWSSEHHSELSPPRKECKFGGRVATVTRSGGIRL